jgi:hypothetical protein
MIHTVARKVGSAIGIVASNAAKVLSGSDWNTTSDQGKPKPKRHASSGRSADPRLGNRSTNKKKKRAAHKRKLKRSHTKD